MSHRPPRKKYKVSSSTAITKQQNAIKEYEDSLKTAIYSLGSLNTLSDLIQLLQSLNDPNDVKTGIWSIYRIFAILIREKRMFNHSNSGTQSIPVDAKKVHRWLIQKFGDYSMYLISLLQDSHQVLRVCLTCQFF